MRFKIGDKLKIKPDDYRKHKSLFAPYGVLSDTILTVESVNFNSSVVTVDKGRHRHVASHILELIHKSPSHPLTNIFA